jgi:hypothetical protein
VKRAAMWRALLICVRNRITLHQSLHGGRPEVMLQVADGDQAFVIRKPDFPHVTVECRFLGERRIDIVFHHRQTDNAEPVTWEEYLDFHVDELDRVQFQHNGELLIGEEEACGMVLRPALDPSFKPPG